MKTPSRKRAIKHLSRRSYTSLSVDVLSSTSSTSFKAVVSQVALKIKREMKDLSSDQHDSILKDNVEGVKMFSWETVKVELNRKLPTLMSLLSHLIPRRPHERVPLMCMIASQLLKCRHQRLYLVQRAVSIMLYGNGTAKQVFYLNVHIIIHAYMHANNHTHACTYRFSLICNL